ncbi:MAG TPA: hypothetical protein PK867_05225 [Pirellulales bacterium]|nr:hypothetical protein [Pirellulales bacterium]
MNDFPILLADIALWIKVVGGVIVALIYLVNYAAQAAGKGQKRPPMRPEARPDPRARPRPAGRQEVQDEVAEFLKRAAEKRTAGRPAEQPPPPQRRALPRSAGAPTPEIVEARAVEEMPSNRWPEPVQSHVDTHQLSDRAEQLAHADRGDAAFQAHMQLFDHQVGRIHEAAQPTSETQAGGPGQAAGTPLSDVFARLLADPQNLRQVIVLNEIMERPRW